MEAKALSYCIKQSRRSVLIKLSLRFTFAIAANSVALFPGQRRGELARADHM